MKKPTVKQLRRCAALPFVVLTAIAVCVAVIPLFLWVLTEDGWTAAKRETRILF